MAINATSTRAPARLLSSAAGAAPGRFLRVPHSGSHDANLRHGDRHDTLTVGDPRSVVEHVSRRPAQFGQLAHNETDLLAILNAGPISPDDLAALSKARARAAQASIDTLIAVLDLLDGDPDLEPSFGFLPHGTASDECEPDVDLEQSLGSPEVEFNHLGRIERRGHIDQRHWSDGHHAVNLWGVDREHDTADEEPTLGAPERPASVRILGSERFVDDTYGQFRWAAGGDSDEREDVDEDGGDINDEPHDADLNEPNLGATNRVDQRRWGAECVTPTGSLDLELDRSDYEPNGDEFEDGDTGVADMDGLCEQTQAFVREHPLGERGYVA